MKQTLWRIEGFCLNTSTRLLIRSNKAYFEYLSKQQRIYKLKYYYLRYLNKAYFGLYHRFKALRKSM